MPKGGGARGGTAKASRLFLFRSIISTKVEKFNVNFIEGLKFGQKTPPSRRLDRGGWGTHSRGLDGSEKKIPSHPPLPPPPPEREVREQLI